MKRILLGLVVVSAPLLVFAADTPTKGEATVAASDGQSVRPTRGDVQEQNMSEPDEDGVTPLACTSGVTVCFCNDPRGGGVTCAAPFTCTNPDFQNQCCSLARSVCGNIDCNSIRDLGATCGG